MPPPLTLSRTLWVPKTRSSSCRTLILMDQAPENIPPDHRSRRSVGGYPKGFGNRRPHVKRSMGSVTVVVSDIGLEDGLEMATPEDEDAIEALTPERCHEPLREGVRERSLDRGADDPYVLGAEDLIEAGRVLTVPVADEETKETAVPGGDEVA